MSTIEISTAHNIVVRFEIATVLQRILAWFIDLLVLLVITFFIAFAARGSELILWLVLFPVWTLYHFLWEVFYKGQSPGKKLLKIRVVTLNGRTPLVIDYFTRWLFRLIDVSLTFGTLGIFFILSSGKGQRIGDMLAQTSVVKSENENGISLESIKKLQNNAKIEFPQIIAYTDEDMLLLKQSIIRYKRYPNESNKEILIRLSDSIQEKLDVKLNGKSTLEFLDKVLYEYIVLTR